MHFWHSAPFLRILFPCLSGIYCGYILPLTATACLWLCIAPILGLLLIRFLVKKPNAYRNRWIHGAFIQLALLLFSTSYSWNHIAIHDPSHFSFSHPAQKEFNLRIEEEPIERNKTFKTTATVLDQKMEAVGNVLLYIDKQDYLNLGYGDIIIAKADFAEVRGPSNPGEFNYKQYLSYKNIYHQASLKNGSYVRIANDPKSLVTAFALDLQHKLLKIFKTHVPGKVESGMSEALLFGYKTDLDPEIVAAYSNTGTLHVLAVSGLHVGIIFIVLAWLLKPLERTKKLRLISSLIIIIFLWLYSLITGFTPSVVRAALMFTLVIIGKLLNRNASIYNSIAASAFLILLFDPLALFDVGFQLSYMAVTGIVFIQPLIAQWWEPQSWIMHQIWLLVTVSIAAQIGTLPLGLYYFHQFPTCFILSNLLIIPLTNIIVYLGIALLALSFIPEVAAIAGEGVAILIRFTNKVVMMIEELPGSLIDDISFSLLQMWILWGLIFAFFLWIYSKRPVYLMLVLSSFMLISSISVFQDAMVYNTSKVSILNIKNSSVVVIQEGQHARILADTAFSNDPAKEKFHLKALIRDAGINDLRRSPEIITSRYIPGIKFINAGSKVIAFADSSVKAYELMPSTINVDMLVLSNNSRARLQTFMKCLNPGKIIADGTNSSRKLKKWKAEAQDLKIDFHSVSVQGAFLSEL